MPEQQQLLDPNDAAGTPAPIPSEPIASDDDGEQAGATDTTGSEAEVTDAELNKRAVEERLKTRAKRRIDELTVDKYAERQLREQAQQRAEDYRRKLEAQTQPQTAEAEPQRAQFDDYEKYIRAVNAYDNRRAVRESEAKILNALQQRDRQTTAVAQAQQIETQFRQRHDEEAKTIPNYHEVIEDSGAEISDSAPHVALEIAQAEHPARLMYYFAQHQDVLRRLEQMNPLQVAREMTRIESTLSGSPQVSNAPAPGKPVGAKGAGSSDPPEDTAAYFKWAEKNLK